jgi:hypothetical protein
MAFAVDINEGPRRVGTGEAVSRLHRVLAFMHSVGIGENRSLLLRGDLLSWGLGQGYIRQLETCATAYRRRLLIQLERLTQNVACAASNHSVLIIYRSEDNKIDDAEIYAPPRSHMSPTANSNIC